MIRDAAPFEYPAIRAVVRRAFGSADEANLIEALRSDGDVLFELVTAGDIGISAHILYSRLRIEREDSDLEAAALAPVSVLPAFQRKGVGARLIQAGNARCAELGLAAILVLGHADYYPGFGFSAAVAEPLRAPFSGPHFMALELKRGVLRAGGRVRYASAFGV